MDFWLDLLFGNTVGLSSMVVIFGTINLMLFYSFFHLQGNTRQISSLDLTN
ncbi:hypothetical protein VSA01S_35350 [Vibrio sagamiensis NBRC 104589]|uniref:DUF3149 domain-containing protein n=1 Tax=Vibrio sagamiensis NBRC 104589 TaxID=1219064 RepID=A0A511QJC7_9VIBR|nr:hypothetical protein VSA01S_35350 [Vibrio sagamiensis NBRC 104589]